MNNIPNIPSDSVNAVLASLLGIALFALGFLYVSKEKRITKVTDDHKEDLKYFNDERQKTVNEITNALNKISINIEENRLNDSEMRRTLDKLTIIVESQKKDT